MVGGVRGLRRAEVVLGHADHEAIRHLAAIGHSSGLDAATGFFYGATIWRKAADYARRAAPSDYDQRRRFSPASIRSRHDRSR